MKKRVVVSRRQVLRGSAGVVLALPFLPSIVPGKAYAQDVTLAAEPRFVAFTANHGGVDEAAMFPSESLLTNTHNLYSGMQIRSGALQPTVSGGETVVSEVLKADSSVLTPALVQKMNVMWGLDIPFYIAHHTGGHLGNFARNDGNGADGKDIQGKPMPTIDQVMAWSNSFYSDLSAVTSRSLVCGRSRYSWGFSTPSTGSGSIQEVRAVTDAPDAFNQLFPNGVPTEEDAAEQEVEEEPLIVDRVLEAYKSLATGNRRLSANDRQRLDDHMDRLSEMQRRVNTLNTACQQMDAPARETDPAENAKLLVDVASVALGCGATRVVVIGLSEQNFVDFGGDWHQDVAHQYDRAYGQNYLRAANSNLFANVVVRLAASLDSVQEGDGTVLDNSLITWSNEHGNVTHEARSIPVVTFGSAGGFFNTGNLYDFQNRTSKGMRVKYKNDVGYAGLTYNQWLATCLLAMGVPRDEWQSITNNADTGYGVRKIAEDYANAHVPGVMENASEPLPLVSVT